MTHVLAELPLGDNIIQLIYPLRRSYGKLEATDELIHWQRRLSGRVNDIDGTIVYDSVGTFAEHPELHDDELLTYFHPTVHPLFFHGISNRSESIELWRMANNQLLHGVMTLNGQDVPFSLRWLSSDLYLIQTIDFLVVRLALQLDGGSVEQWSQFAAQIRCNVRRDDGATLTFFAEDELVRQYADLHRLSYFFAFICQWMKEDEWLRQFTFAYEKPQQRSLYHHVEPLSFTHHFVSTPNVDYRWSDDDLYRLVMEEYDAIDELFVAETMRHHTYNRRRAQGTVFSTVPNGALTVATGQVQPLIRHHCHQQLMMLILQLSYREELTELLSALATTQTNRKRAKRAKRIVQSYNQLNQYFIVERVTNDVQGNELWRFYGQTLRIASLYEAVRNDIHELNQQLIQHDNEKQSSEIMFLAIITFVTGMLGMNRLIGNWPSYADDVSAPESTYIGMMLDCVALGGVIVGIVYTLHLVRLFMSGRKKQ